MIKGFQEKYGVLIIALIAVIIISMPYFVRLNTNPTLTYGGESYYNLLKAKQVLEGDVTNDLLVNAESPYRFNLYHYYLAAIIWVVGVNWAPLVSSLLLTFLFSVFFMQIIRHRFSGYGHIFVFAVILSSPLLLNVFSSVHEYSLILVLQALALYLAENKQRFMQLLSLPVYFALGLFGIIHAAIAVYLLFVLLRSRQIMNASIAAVLIGSQFVLYIELMPVPLLQSLLSTADESLLLAVLGMPGFSVFSILLFILGIIFSWQYKSRIVAYYLLFFILAVVAFMNASYLIYLNLLAAIFAGYALLCMYARNWSLKNLRSYSLFIISLGLVFSFMAFLKFVAVSAPAYSTISILEDIRGGSDDTRVLFTHPNSAAYARYAGFEVILDSEGTYVPDFEQREEDIDRIFRSNDLEEIKKLLSKYKITHVLLTRDTIEDLNLPDEQGLRFILSNNETFKYIYEDTSIQIWTLDQVEENNV